MLKALSASVHCVFSKCFYWLYTVDPASISVAVTPPSGSPLPNDVELFTVSCTVTVPAGLDTLPSVQWLTQDGIPLQNVPIDTMFLPGGVLGDRIITNLTIPTQDVSGGESLVLICRAVVSSSVLPQDIVRQVNVLYTTGPACMLTFQLLLGELNNCLEWVS